MVAPIVACGSGNLADANDAGSDASSADIEAGSDSQNANFEADTDADGRGRTTFSDVYSTIISSQCLPCHAVGVGKASGMLDMSSEDAAYANLVGVVAAGVSCSKSGLTRVAPGSAQTSLLFDKVNAKLGAQLNPPCGDPMPDNASVLTQAQVDLIAAWINGGAQK